MADMKVCAKTSHKKSIGADTFRLKVKIDARSVTMFQSLHNVVMKPFRRTTSQEPCANTNSDATSARNDRLEDGFLLVGQTSSERTTVFTNSFHSERVDPPPGYDESQKNTGLPTYTDFNANRPMFSPTLNVSNSPSQHQGNSAVTATPSIQTTALREDHGHTDSLTSPILDIPFVIAGQLANQKSVSDLRTSNLLMEKRFSLCSYDYDFRLEMSVLNEQEQPMDER